MGKKYWLFKSEPSCYSIDDLARSPQKTDHWDGVRNYQARNFMRDEMQVGDLGFFYHSSCKEPGIVGTVKVIKQAYPDHTAWDPQEDHFDPKSTQDNPRWFMVDLQLVKKFNQIIPLQHLKENHALAGMLLLRRGNRLSITPVSPAHWEVINQAV